MQTDQIKITVAWVQYGQPRAYADSFYEARVFFEKNGRHYFLTKEAATPWLQVSVRKWFEKPEWYQGTLEILTGIKEDACSKPSYEAADAFCGWHIRVREAYTD